MAEASAIPVDELLVEAVKAYPTLHDKACQDFRDQNKKELVWQDVAQKASFPSVKGHTHKAKCKRAQHCWQKLPNIFGSYMLRLFAHPVACHCAKFQTGQTFQPTIPNISFVLRLPKHGATMLERVVQYCRHITSGQSKLSSGHLHLIMACLVGKGLCVMVVESYELYE